jgi:hypothetical protein
MDVLDAGSRSPLVNSSGMTDLKYYDTFSARMVFDNSNNIESESPGD